MTEEQKAAYVMSQMICAQAKIEGMRAENTLREMRGEALAYSDEDFFAVIEEFGIHQNAVMKVFTL